MPHLVKKTVIEVLDEWFEQEVKRTPTRDFSDSDNLRRKTRNPRVSCESVFGAREISRACSIDRLNFLPFPQSRMCFLPIPQSLIPPSSIGKIALMLLSLGAPFSFATSACGQGGPAIVRVAKVIEMNLAAEQSFVANVRPHRRTVVGSAVAGRVLEYPIDAGQEVKAGDTLTQLRITTIGIELAAAQAELDLKKAELAELKNGSRPAELALAQASLRAGEASKAYAAAKFRRFEDLFNRGSGVSRDEFEAAQAESLKAVAELAQSQSSLDLVQEGPRVERIQQAAAKVAVQEQIVEGLVDRMAKYTIRAPFDGYIASESTELGAWVNQGDVVAEVVEIDPIDVEVFVPESSVWFVRIGMKLDVKVDAIGDDMLSGTVERIVPVADARSRTFPVHVVVPNPKVDGRHRLLPGMLGRVALPAGDEQSRFMVPKDALQHGGETPVIWKVVNDKAVVVPVITGPSSGDNIAVMPIQSGALAVGDDVITRGNERLRPGQDVTK